MKVFLSHSSADKAFVEQVATSLRPGTYELDSLTFEKGEMSVEQIVESMKRVDLFCLFLSESAALSRFVEFEQRIAFELIGAGKIGSFLTICLDDRAFNAISSSAKFFNAIRRISSAEAAAHFIKGKLISARKSGDQSGHPFIGRDKELRDLEEQALDFNRPRIKALFLSGNAGVGRRSIVENFVARQYPQVLRSYPRFEVEPYAGLDEIYRQVLESINPSISISDYVKAIEDFSRENDSEKADIISGTLSGLLDENLICFAVDSGGLLQDSGALSPEMESIIDRLRDHPHPPLAIISPRMTPRSLRRSAKDVIYLAVGPLSRDDAGKLVSWALRGIGARPTREQVDDLIELSDFHPYNVYEMKERISEVGVQAFLANTGGFQAWKHKETSEYFRGISIGDLESGILAVLLLAPELDFGSLVTSLGAEPDDVSNSVQRLLDLHVLRHSDDRFAVSPALRIAVERDSRVKFKKEERAQVVSRLAKSLSISLDNGVAPVALADAAVLTALESGEVMGAIANALLLPSHRVWLAQRHYDAAEWPDSLRLAQDAVKEKSRLSSQGYIAGCRLYCLSAARLNRQVEFEDGIGKLKLASSNNWTKSNIEFLNGFNARLRGRVLDAESFFKEAFRLNENDRSTARELASICLITGDSAGAERFARKASELATNNPYTIDILVSALVKSLGPKCLTDIEVEDLLERLVLLDNEDQKSFSYTRRAEMELLYGDANVAELHIKEAIKRTPHLFEPKLLRARIYLKQGRKKKWFGLSEQVLGVF